MQGSNFSREVENPGQQGSPPQPVVVGLTPQSEDPLAHALQHLQVSLDELRAAQGQIARQHEELDAIRAEVVAISEMERGRIGRDLHDVLGQILTGIAFLGKMLERRLQGRGLDETVDARQICDLAGEGMRQTRALARGLCPIQLRADELVPSLKTLAVDTQQTFHMACHFDHPQEPGVVRDDEVATNLYCIVQEAITNAVKHGKARNAHLRLYAHDGLLVLTVRDDGVGFQQADSPNGIGLRIMSHRVNLLGGTLAVESQPGEGTTVTCTIPAGRPK